jgi:hypothetical protein
MEVFDGRAYMAFGDTARNAGPCPVVTYDPLDEKFARERWFEEQAIYRFRSIGGKLYAPGAEPMDLSQDGFLFARDLSGWRDHSVSLSVHCYDAAEHGGGVYIAYGAKNGSGASVFRIAEAGQEPKQFEKLGPLRTHSLFSLGDRLYASTYVGGVLVLGPGGFTPSELEIPPPPHGPDDENVTERWGGPWRVADRPVAFKGHALYIGMKIRFDGKIMHNTPFGVFRVLAKDTGSLATLPIEVPGKPTDLFLAGDAAYIVSNEKLPGAAANRDFMVYVSQSDDGEIWRQFLRFHAPALVRSACILKGNFYFGLGCDHDDYSKESGLILRTPVPPILD